MKRDNHKGHKDHIDKRFAFGRLTAKNAKGAKKNSEEFP